MSCCPWLGSSGSAPRRRSTQRRPPSWRRTARATIGDYVWYDANVDGNNLGTETEWTAGIDPVLVNLYMDKNGDGVMDPGELIGAMYTGDDPLTVPVEPPGWYRFTDLVV